MSAPMLCLQRLGNTVNYFQISDYILSMVAEFRKRQIRRERQHHLALLSRRELADICYGQYDQGENEEDPGVIHVHGPATKSTLRVVSRCDRSTT